MRMGMCALSLFLLWKNLYLENKESTFEKNYVAF